MEIHVSAPGSVVEIEVDQIPVPDEPGKAEAAKSQGDVEDLGPDPVVGSEPALKSVVEHDESGNGGKQAHGLQQVQKWIHFAIEVGDIIGLREEENPGAEKQQIDDADDSN